MNSNHLSTLRHHQIYPQTVPKAFLLFHPRCLVSLFLLTSSSLAETIIVQIPISVSPHYHHHHLNHYKSTNQLPRATTTKAATSTITRK